MRCLIYLYILAMPFVSAFAFSEHFNIPLLIAVLLLLYIPIDILNEKKIQQLSIGIHVLSLILWLFIVFFSYLYNSIGDTTTTNHLFAYYTVFFCDFIAIQYYLLKYRREEVFFKNIISLINLIVAISAIYGCVEFILIMSGHPIDPYIPRPAVTEYSMNALNGDFLIKRIRGFSEESGHFSFMLEIFIPIQVYYLFYSDYSKIPFLFKISLLIVSIIATLLTVSTATFIFFPIALLLTYLIFWKTIWANIFRFILYLIPIFLIILYAFYKLPIAKLIELSIGAKLNGSSSMDDRSGRLSSFVDTFLHAPLINQIIGYGPSGYKIAGLKDAFVSLYPTFIFESGILGFIFYLFFHGFVFYKLLKIKDKIGFFLTISFLTGSLHYFVIGNYWYPWFWFLCAFIIYFKQKEQNEEILID